MSSKETNKDYQRNNHKNDDDPFTLIEKGNSLESSKNRWGSSDYYSRAHSLLLEEYHNMMKTIHKDSTFDIDTNVIEPKSNDKQKYSQKKKVAALYHDQSVEYLHKARQSLIGALMFEREEDLKRWGDIEPMVDIVHYNNNQRKEEVVFDPIMMVLTKEEMERRIDTFRRLFVSSWEKVPDNIHGNKKEKDVVVHDIEVQTEPMNDETDLDRNNEYDQGTISLEERLAMLAPINTKSNDNGYGNGNEAVNDEIELSLEQRLAKLNSSLTNKSIQKSDDERFKNIQSGLNDLGVYIPSNNVKNVLDDHSLTDDEQFNLIMNMAKDEAALDMQQTGERDSTDEAIEDLLRRSGIRIDMPLDDEDVDEIVYGENNEDEDVRFSSISSLKKAGFVPDDDEVESDNHEINNLEDVRRILSKSQQMLLQASICLDECGDVKSYFVSRKKILTMESDDKACEQNFMIDCPENNEVKGKDVEESPEKSVDVDGKDRECENKEDIVVPEIINEDKDELLVEVTENPSNENDHATCLKDSKSIEDGDDIINDGDAKEVDHSSKDELETKEDKTNKIAPIDNVETTEEIRIRNLGRESLVIAKMYLERLLEAWPEDEVNEA